MFTARLPLTLCHFQHFYLLLRSGAHFLDRGQDGRQRLDQSLFKSLLNGADSRTGPSVTRRTHACCVFTRSPLRSMLQQQYHHHLGRSEEPQPETKRANAWKRGGGVFAAGSMFCRPVGPERLWLNPRVFFSLCFCFLYFSALWWSGGNLWHCFKRDHTYPCYKRHWWISKYSIDVS